MKNLVEILELYDELHQLVSWILIDKENIDCEPIIKEETYE